MPRKYLTRNPKRRRFLRKKPLRSMVKSIVAKAVETKFYPTKASYADLEATSQRIINLCPMTEGSSPINRQGATISPVRIKGKIAIKAVAGTGPVVARVQLIRFKQMNAVAPTLADILPDSSADLTMLAVDQPFADTDSGYGMVQGRHRFQILYDRTKQFSSTSNDASNLLHIWTINKKLGGKTTYVDNDMNPATQGGNNQYYLYIHTDAGADVLEECHDLRFHFKDA